MKMELRVQNAELRANEDGTMSVQGYVNKTEQLSEMLGVTKRFKEKIARGAFSRALKSATKDIHFLMEHNNKQILASTRNNSLQLHEDEQGLFMSAQIASTSWGKDAYELIKSGIYQNMSFGFHTISDSWKPTGPDLFERTITDLELIEVSVVRDPAYSQSSIAARSIEIVEDPEFREIEEIQEEVKEDLDLQIRKVQIQIEKQKSSISTLESFVARSTNEIGKSTLKRELEKLEERERKLSELKKEQRKQEEQKMEERNLQGTTEGKSTISQQVAPIVELLESSSDVVANARKIELIGANMKIPYETSLDSADFVLEGENIPMINLNLAERDTLTAKRVGVMQNISKVLLNESKGMDEHSKKLLMRRVGKKIEEEILTGDNVKGLKGLAPDPLVPSVTFAITPTEEMLRALYLKVNSEYRPYCKWYMSEAYFEKVSKLIVNNEYLVKSKTIEGKVIPTLFGHEIEISSAMQAGDTITNTPIIFVSIEDSYTLAIAKDIEFKQVTGTAEALNGSVSFKAEALLDGCCHNYQAVAKGVIE
ncbi:phage major capsid protein [Priestia endophytica]|uniref:phage major capsid protein n=1 Tax=Priestia endophytica TaxID=135735 RepID=UPI00124C0FDD|nr:phage major capsid protein [Priestia endophytica]KAB2489980.1 phage major capsid protein [Priestia endophytica]